MDSEERRREIAKWNEDSPVNKNEEQTQPEQNPVSNN